MKNRNKTFIQRTICIILASFMFFVMAGISGFTGGTEVVNAADRDQVKKTVMIEGVAVTSDIANSDLKLETLLKLGGFPEDSQRKAFKKYYKEVLGMMKDEGFDQKSVQKRADELKETSKVKEGKVTEVADFMTGKLITAPGFFTGGYKEDNYATCEALKTESNKEQAKIMEEQSAEKTEIAQVGESDNAKAKGNKSLIEMLGGVNEGFIDPEDAEATKADDISGNGLLGINCSDLGFFKNLTNLYKPINITDSDFIMNMVFAFQVIAMAIAVLLIAVFGAYYATGNETAVDPFKFAIRAFVVFLLVYYLPYFAQDILNINNMLVYWIGMTDISVSGSSVVAAGILTFAASISTILLAFAQGAAFGAGPALLLIGSIMLLILIVFISKAIITLVFWWYARFLMIMFLVILGPVFIVMMILPKTASYGTKWLQFLIGEIFTQTFMVIGFFFVESLFSNLALLQLGIIGNTIILYSSILLLSRIPDISKRLVGADIGGVGWSDARKVGNDVSKVIQNAGVAAVSSVGAKYLNNKAERLAEEGDKLDQIRDTPEFQTRVAQKRNKKFEKDMKGFSEAMNNGESIAKVAQSAQSGKFNFDSKGVMDKLNATHRNKDAIDSAQGDHYKAYKDSELDKLRAKEDEKWMKDAAGKENSINNAKKKVEEAEEKLGKASTEEEKAEAQQEVDEAKAFVNKLQGAWEKAQSKYLEDTTDASLEKDQAYIRKTADDKLMQSLDKALGTADYKNGLEKRVATSAEFDEQKAKTVGSLKEKQEKALAGAPSGIENEMPELINGSNTTTPNSLMSSLNSKDDNGSYHMPELNRSEVKPLADDLGKATKELAQTKEKAVQSVMNQAQSRNQSMDMATANSIVEAQATQSSLLSLPNVKGDLSNLNDEQRKQYDEASKTLEGQPEAVLSMAKNVSGGVISAENNLQGAVQNFHNNSGLDKKVATSAINAVKSGAAVSHAITSPTIQGMISEGIQKGGTIDVDDVAQNIASTGLVSGENAVEYANQIQATVAQAHQGIASTVSSMQGNPTSQSPEQFVETLTSQYASAGVNTADAKVQAATTVQAVATKAYDKEVGAKALTYMVDEGYSKNDAYQLAQNDVGAAPNFINGDLSTLSMVSTPVTSVSASTFNDKVQKEIGQSFDSGIANRPTFSESPVTADAISKYGLEGAQQKFDTVTTAVQKAHAFTNFDKIPDFAKKQVHELVKQGPINDSQKSGLRDNIIKELDGHGMDRRDSRAIADTYIDYSFENELTGPVNLSLPEDYKNIIKTQVVEMKQENPNGKINMRRELENYAGNNQALLQESLRYSQELIDALENE